MPHASGVWQPGLQVEALGVELRHVEVRHDRVSPSPPAWVFLILTPTQGILCSLSSSVIITPSLTALLSSRQKLHVPRCPALVTQLPRAIYSTAVSLDCAQPQVQVPLPYPFPSPNTIRRTNLKLSVRAGKPLQQEDGVCRGMQVC